MGDVAGSVVSGMGVLAGSVSLAGPPACGTRLFLR